jgi:hypothetical protein
LLAEVPLATSAGGDETDEIAVSAATPFGFLAFSRAETLDATGADCCLRFEAQIYRQVLLLCYCSSSSFF